MIILSNDYSNTLLKELVKRDNIVYFDNKTCYQRLSKADPRLNLDMCYWSQKQNLYVNNLGVKCYGYNIIVKPPGYKIPQTASKGNIVINLKGDRKVL